MSVEGSQGNREVPLTSRPMEEGGSWGKAGRGQPTRGRCPRMRGKAPREKHGFPHGSEAEASDAHQGLTGVVSVAVVSVGGGRVVVSTVGGGGAE